MKKSLADPSAFLLGLRRRDQRRCSVWRYGANCVANFWVSWAAGLPIEDTQSGFRLYPATFLRSLDIPHGKERSFVFESEALIEAGRGGTPIDIIDVGVAARTGPRPSHFRPVLDITRITVMVAWKLLSRGMYPMGLYRVLARQRRHQNSTEGRKAFLTGQRQ